jgi:hypothetical protein
MLPFFSRPSDSAISGLNKAKNLTGSLPGFCEESRHLGKVKMPLGGRMTKSLSDSRTVSTYLLSSSMCRIGISARLRTGSGRVISGSMFKSASYAFSRVFIFMNRHSPQKQLSVGPGINVLCGISLCSRCNRPASVTTMISCAGDSLQNVTIFSVEQTSSASIRTA